MSRNVDAVRRWTDAYNSRDFEALIEVTDPEFQFRSRFVAIESEFRGYEGFPHAYFRMLDEAYDRFQVIPSDFIDAGAAVLTVANADWRGKASGAEGSLPIFVASWLRAGRLIRTETFTDRAEGLEAVGLEKQAMSQENVRLHGRANEAFNTRNVEAFVAFCDPEIELHSAVTVPGGGIYRGHDGVRRWHRDLEDVFGGEIRIDPEVFFDLGEYTLTFHVLRGRGQQSGAGVATPAAHLCRWRDGRIIHFKGYVHREEVFSDLGIPKDAWNRSLPGELARLDAFAGS